MPEGQAPDGDGPPPRAETTQAPRDGTLERLQDTFERFLALARLLVLIPVIVLVLAALWAFVYAVAVFIASVPASLEHPLPVAHKLGVFVVEIDLFLIGATLIIAAFGFYELFISKIDPGGRLGAVPRWLQMRDLNDLKARVASMLILVLAVTFVDLVLEGHTGVEAIYVGAGVGLVIAALTAFLAFGSRE
ncbi:MAG: YqhA family protein [Actinobacteria bacterium]|nr:YqhA family protein [Actinomycetota bacterium]